MFGTSALTKEAAAGNVETRIDGVDLALEDVLRVGVDLDANGLADPDRRQEPFRHPEISLDRIDGLQIDEGLTRGDVFAGAHMAQTDNAGERRYDARLVELHAGKLDRGGVHGKARRRFVDRLSRRVFVLEELARPLVGLLGKLELGLGIGELGAIDGIVEGEERRALLHRLSFLEMDFLEAPRDLRADGNRFIGEKRADGGDLLAQGCGNHLGGLDRHRLLGVLRHRSGAGQSKTGGQKPPERATAANSQRHLASIPKDQANNLSPIRQQRDPKRSDCCRALRNIAAGILLGARRFRRFDAVFPILFDR